MSLWTLLSVVESLIFYIVAFTTTDLFCVVLVCSCCTILLITAACNQSLNKSRLFQQYILLFQHGPCGRTWAGPAPMMFPSSHTLPFQRRPWIESTVPPDVSASYIQRLGWSLQPPLLATPSHLPRALKAPVQLHICRAQHKQMCYWHRTFRWTEFVNGKGLYLQKVESVTH